MTTVRALLPAAGAGRRFGGGIPKQHSLLNGRPLMEHTVGVFMRMDEIASVHVVLAADGDSADLGGWAGAMGGDRLRIHRCGGATRAGTVLNCLLEMGGDSSDWIMVHDVVRPCVDSALIGRVLEGIDGEEHGRVAAVPAHDTIKRVPGGKVRETLGRKDVWLAQTPQVFRHGDLVGALRVGTDVTDESAAFEVAGRFPTLVMGDPSNIKVTTPADLELAQAILLARTAA